MEEKISVKLTLKEWKIISELLINMFNGNWRKVEALPIRRLGEKINEQI